MREIIIDGVVYEAYEKKEPLLNPLPGDFIIYTHSAHGFWLVYRVLFFATKGKKAVMVGENSNGYLCVSNCTYSNFVKKYRSYNGEDGAHPNDKKWWSEETGNIEDDIQ